MGSEATNRAARAQTFFWAYFSCAREICVRTKYLFSACMLTSYALVQHSALRTRTYEHRVQASTLHWVLLGEAEAGALKSCGTMCLWVLSGEGAYVCGGVCTVFAGIYKSQFQH